MKYVNKFGSVADAVAHSGSMSPNISFVAGSANPNNLVTTNVGDNKEIIFQNAGGGLLKAL